MLSNAPFLCHLSFCGCFRNLFLCGFPLLLLVLTIPAGLEGGKYTNARTFSDLPPSVRFLWVLGDWRHSHTPSSAQPGSFHHLMRCRCWGHGLRDRQHVMESTAWDQGRENGRRKKKRCREGGLKLYSMSCHGKAKENGLGACLNVLLWKKHPRWLHLVRKRKEQKHTAKRALVELTNILGLAESCESLWPIYSTPGYLPYRITH